MITVAAESRVQLRKLAISCRLITALLCVLSPVSVDADVEVEFSRTLTRESVYLPAQTVASYEYMLDAGSELVFSVRLARWRRSDVGIWLVDERNFENLIAGHAFDFINSGTGMIRREGQIAFAVATAGRYFVVLDNSLSRFEREVDVYSYLRTAMPGPADARAREFYEAHFDALSAIIDMGGINVHVRRCGEVNAFSIGSRVVICRELENQLSVTATPGVRLFVLLHEVSHSLIAGWGYRSIVRNQYMVDRLAASLFALVDRDGSAEAAVAWFERQSAGLDESNMNEPLLLSKSRARRIARWLQEDGELDRNWTRRIVVSRIRTAALEELVHATHLDAQSRRRIELELAQRKSADSPEST